MEGSLSGQMTFLDSHIAIIPLRFSQTSFASFVSAISAHLAIRLSNLVALYRLMYDVYNFVRVPPSVYSFSQRGKYQSSRESAA